MSDGLLNYEVYRNGYAPYNPALRGKMMPACITDVFTRKVIFVLTSENVWWDMRSNAPAIPDDLYAHTWRVHNPGPYNAFVGLVHTGVNQFYKDDIWVEIVRCGRGIKRYTCQNNSNQGKKNFFQRVRKMQDLIIQRNTGIDMAR